MIEERTRTIYYGDNLGILRAHIAPKSVDMVYLDPPFKSQQEYNVLFRSVKGEPAAAQVRAFTDTWKWDAAARATYEQLMNDPLVPGNVSKMIEAFHEFLGGSEMLAYLVMMTPRLMELHNALKPTGSLYLHCDPAASHYLKLVLDTIFRPENFRNEIVWRRTGAHSDARRFPRVSDRLLFYSKSGQFTWNQIRHRGEEHTQDKHYSYEDERGRYRLDNLNPPGGRGPVYEFCGFTRPWRFTRQKILQLKAEGLIVSTHGKVPQLKRYFKPDIPVTELWTDIPPINSQAKERLGYPTQKPQELLRRIIQATTNPGELILDPFCGCGTALVAAEELGRSWIGIDITYLAVDVMARRLRDHFPGISFKIRGQPQDEEGAKALAERDRFQFQVWALSLVGAQSLDPDRKGADKGIDGYLPYQEQLEKFQRAIVQVKSGHVGAKDVRDLRGTLEREKAPFALLITLETPTGPMQREAVEAGSYEASFTQEKIPRVQIITISELLKGQRARVPTTQLSPVPIAPKIKLKRGEQPPLQ